MSILELVFYMFLYGIGAIAVLLAMVIALAGWFND